jgi:hypothetical protein
VPEAVNIVANTGGNTVQVVEPAKISVSEFNNNNNAIITTTAANPTQLTNGAKTVSEDIITPTTNLLEAGAAAGSQAAMSVVPNQTLDKNFIMKSVIPIPLQPVLDPVLAPEAATTNMTRGRARNHPVITKGIPFAIATGAGVIVTLGTEAVLTAGTAGLAAIPGIAAAGAVGSGIHHAIYTTTSRAARKFMAKHGGTNTGPLLTTLDDHSFDRTAEIERVNAEIQAEKNRPLDEKVKSVVPLLIGGGLGNIVGAGVGHLAGSALEASIKSSIGAKAAHHAIREPVNLITTSLSAVAIKKAANATSSGKGNNSNATDTASNAADQKIAAPQRSSSTISSNVSDIPIVNNPSL